MVKAEKTENLCCQASTAVCVQARAVRTLYFLWYGRVCAGTGRGCCQDFVFYVLRAFSPISALNWPLT